MAERRSPGSGSYLDRLVERPGRVNVALARAPHRLAWGPPRQSPPDEQATAEISTGPSVRPAPRRRPSDPPQRTDPQRVHQDRGETHSQRLTVQTPAHEDPAPRATRAQTPQVESLPVAEPDSRRPRGARRGETRVGVAPQQQTLAEPGRAVVVARTDREERPPGNRPDVMPGSVGRALERLAARSLPLGAYVEQASTPRPTPRPPAPTSPSPQPLLARSAQPVLTPQTRRVTVAARQEPHVRIGSIEVTITGPPQPPPPTFATPTRTLEVLPPPVTRLSRPPSGYGLGQG